MTRLALPIVFVTSEGEERAAIVTRVHSDTLVNLTAFSDNPNSPFSQYTSVSHDGAGAPGSWHHADFTVP